MRWQPSVVSTEATMAQRSLLTAATGIYYSAATISGAFSGFIAYGATRNLTKAATGLEPWRWVYIIDGVIAIVVGFVTLALLPAFPDTLKKKGKKHWLFTEQELDIACRRVACAYSPGCEFQWTNTY